MVESPSLQGITQYVLWVVYNLLLLPLVAATPFVPHQREDADGWLKAFGARENYLLQVASFQAFSFQVIDLSHSLPDLCTGRLPIDRSLLGDLGAVV